MKFSTQVYPVAMRTPAYEVWPVDRELLNSVARLDSAVFGDMVIGDTRPSWDASDYALAVENQWRVCYVNECSFNPRSLERREQLPPVRGVIVFGMNAGRQVIIERIAVPPYYRRRGFGRALLMHAVHWAIDARALNVVMPIPDSTPELVKAMESARGLARHCDFTFDQERNGYVEFIRRFR